MNDPAAGADSIRFGPARPGIERAEVRLSTCAFEPHRHDTYAIGITTAGVQTFRYRGARRVCLPGQLHVLHPDETHDGAPATDDGFGYRILYLAPELVREALGGAGASVRRRSRPDADAGDPVLAGLLADVDEPIGDLARAEIAAAVADALRALGGRAGRGGRSTCGPSSSRASTLRPHAREHTPATALERITGTDRFTLARHFRRAFGTSPDRYRTLRRLALAREAIESGLPLVDAAADTGFADQSHLTRQFKRAYGLTPGRWAAVTGPAGAR